MHSAIRKGQVNDTLSHDPYVAANDNLDELQQQKLTAMPAPQILSWLLANHHIGTDELDAGGHIIKLASLVRSPLKSAVVRPGTFTFAADFNAGKRDASKAKATGVMAGETDLRVYGHAARLLLIEYKNAEGRLSADQVKRHALLRALGYRVDVIKAATPDECAARSVALVRGWLSVNDNIDREAA